MGRERGRRRRREGGGTARRKEGGTGEGIQERNDDCIVKGVKQKVKHFSCTHRKEEENGISLAKAFMHYG